MCTENPSVPSDFQNIINLQFYLHRCEERKSNYAFPWRLIWKNLRTHETLSWKMTHDRCRWQFIYFNESFYLWWHQFFVHSSACLLYLHRINKTHTHTPKQQTCTFTHNHIVCSKLFPHVKFQTKTLNPQRRIRNAAWKICFKKARSTCVLQHSHTSESRITHTTTKHVQNKSTNQSPTSTIILFFFLQKFDVNLASISDSDLQYNICAQCITYSMVSTHAYYLFRLGLIFRRRLRHFDVSM